MNTAHRPINSLKNVINQHRNNVTVNENNSQLMTVKLVIFNCQILINHHQMDNYKNVINMFMIDNITQEH